MQKTAWFMLQRIRLAMQTGTASMIGHFCPTVKSTLEDARNATSPSKRSSGRAWAAEAARGMWDTFS
jgi:hypothetical protein